MQKLKFNIVINAPVEKVWDTMLSDQTYRDWTSLFHAGSYFEGSWEQGSDMRFLGPEDDGTLSGMISRIKENRKYQFVSIEHLGMISHGVEERDSEQAKLWVGAHENYTFTAVDGGTQVDVEIDVIEDFKDYMNETWPLALARLKELVEG